MISDSNAFRASEQCFQNIGAMLYIIQSIAFEGQELYSMPSRALLQLLESIALVVRKHCSEGGVVLFLGF